MTLLMI